MMHELTYSQKRALQIALAVFRARVAEEKAAMDARLEAMREEFAREVEQLERELFSTRSAYEELKVAVLARERAAQELASLHRARAIARAQAIELTPETRRN
jgi:hypothetical protein